MFVGSVFGSHLFEIWVDGIGTGGVRGIADEGCCAFECKFVHVSALLLVVHKVRKELAFTYKRIIVVHNLK